ncbi:pyrroloquinoline-quinone synthase [Thermomonospora echinospora]|uniref:Pyrroloquinoline-quinone synthase n=1 Tax=Thermomonospora echinospora TaxID=1992 RepID=A0A1H6C503_9ACTN|nr:pyrroloquinoline-quinone synthase PqqC [Thermomonospora echinospora]SEG67436.1 pyrroloquinoline-quinone synthase [Thermomonospora echinospora]
MPGASQVLTAEEFTTALRARSARYWDRHPFHLRLHEGSLTEAEVRGWVANRWVYQKCLPQKNAFIIANCPHPEIRRMWLERIAFHDGTAEGEGGIEDWLALAESAGLTRQEVLDERHVAPGARFAVQAYLDFVRTRPWEEGVAASLTELFAPDLMRDRVAAFRKHYPWIKPEGHAYFTRRLPVVSSDSDRTLAIVLRHCATRERQEAALAALTFKCDVLWALADAIEHATACDR